MTVEELINLLNTIEDKTIVVKAFGRQNCSLGYVFAMDISLIDEGNLYLDFKADLDDNFTK
jgi:hypothetical protein